MSGNLGKQLPDLWEKLVVTFYPDIDFQLLSGPGSSLLYFVSWYAKCFHLVKGLDGSQVTPALRCFYYEATLLYHRQNVMLLWNLYIPFSIVSALADVQVAGSIFTNAQLYHQRCRLLNWALHFISSDHRTIFFCLSPIWISSGQDHISCLLLPTSQLFLDVFLPSHTAWTNIFNEKDVKS